MIQFTRYLYIKDEVELSLFSSLLNKDEKESVFWASELYYSGLIPELIHLLWKIYYDLYASLNHSFGKYLLSKLKPSITIDTLHNVVGNFVLRPFNIDILFCKIMSETFYFEFDSSIENYWENNDYLFLICLLLKDKNNEQLLLLENSLQQNGVRLSKEYKAFEKYSQQSGVDINIIIASFVLYNINKVYKKPTGKNLFIELENTYDFSTIQCNLNNDPNNKHPLLPILPARDILRTAHLMQIDKFQFLSLFDLKRDELSDKQLADSYWNHWEYYCYKTPYWNKIMKLYDVKLEKTKKKITFLNDDEYEKQEGFYNNYGLDTDELPLEISNKSIGKIQAKQKWMDMYNKFKGTVEIDNEYIEDIIKYKYI
jgi:hypothetical protein